jgi:SAM-dependent methyltransferase
VPAQIVGRDGRSQPSTKPPRHEVAATARQAIAESELVEPEQIEDEAEAIADVVEEVWEGEWEDGPDNPDNYVDAPSFLDEVIAGNIDSKRTPQPQPKPDLGQGVSHPARYSEELIPHFAGLLEGYRRVLDPFAGTGKIFQLREHGHDVVAVELEPEWANCHPDVVVGNALHLPFAADTFDAICTSPTYGNRLADHHNAYDPEARRSYTHDLGRQLSPDNSGAMQWGDEYRDFHIEAWREALRVLKPNGRFVLNLKDHIRGGAWQDVLGWHVAACCRLGFEPKAIRPVITRSLRTGATADLRVDAEMIFAFDKGQP